MDAFFQQFFVSKCSTDIQGTTFLTSYLGLVLNSQYFKKHIRINQKKVPEYQSSLSSSDLLGKIKP